MKYIFCLLLLASCSKSNINSPGPASLTIINAVVGADTLVTNFSGEDTLPTNYINADFLIYNFYSSNTPGAPNINQFNSYSGKQQLALYRYPDTLPKSTPLFRLTLDLPVGSVNSLFLSGTAASPDTMFIADHPPYHPSSDSTMGIRFVNLSAGSAPVSINLQGQSNGSEAAGLGYK